MMAVFLSHVTLKLKQEWLNCFAMKPKCVCVKFESVTKKAVDVTYAVLQNCGRLPASRHSYFDHHVTTPPPAGDLSHAFLRSRDHAPSCYSYTWLRNGCLNMSLTFDNLLKTTLRFGILVILRIHKLSDLTHSHGTYLIEEVDTLQEVEGNEYYIYVYF